jgi:glycosyltransferase involved in cell wall biosynthesis
MTHMSVIIPARNEAALIRQTIEAALAASDALAAETELIVVDNASVDQTAAIVAGFGPPVRRVYCARLGSAAARNAGAQAARGAVLVFVDADTFIPVHTLCRIADHCRSRGQLAGITRLAPQERGVRARLWWSFWSAVRRLPLPRAKAMPALMFCTREAFQRFGPFDETVSIGEEWPILAGVYRRHPDRFVYDRALVARSSSRRMELQRFGYTRTFARYIWAVLHRSGRIGYPDTVRHTASENNV